MQDRITSVKNPRVQALTELKTKQGREAAGAFLAEGEKLVREALAAGLARELWTDESGERFSELLRRAGEQGVPVTYAGENVLMKLCSGVTPQGIAAVCGFPPAGPRFFRAGGRYAAAEGVQNPGNVGALIRAADAFALDGVLLIGPCADLYNPKTVRATMGSLLRVPVCHFDTAAEAITLLREAGIVSFAATLSDDSVSLPDVSFPNGCAVWIGSETAGLLPETATACERRVKIPMAGGAESLNAAQAAAILLWEMTRRGDGGSGKE